MTFEKQTTFKPLPPGEHKGLTLLILGQGARNRRHVLAKSPDGVVWSTGVRTLNILYPFSFNDTQRRALAKFCGYTLTDVKKMMAHVQAEQFAKDREQKERDLHELARQLGYTVSRPEREHEA
jgi:hypothetical protein